MMHALLIYQVDLGEVTDGMHRQRHVAIKPRDLSSGLSEDELDRLVADM